jgi:predicted RND superfamily exporter protein
LNRYLKKTLYILILIVINSFIFYQIPKQDVQWNDFFPKETKQQIDNPLTTSNIQYMFVELPKYSLAQELVDNDSIVNFYRINKETDLYLLIFDPKQQNNLLEKMQDYNTSGTSIIGFEVMKNFVDELKIYLYYIVPILILILLLLTSVQYGILILFELLLYTTFLLVFIYFIDFTLTPFSLLALNFLFIYAFTLFNYFFSGEITRNKLLFGIFISIFTTSISAVLLYKSEFGLIHSFGETLLIGLFILLLFSYFRIYLLNQDHFSFSWFKYLNNEQPFLLRFSFPLLIALGVIVFINYKHYTIDLNPLNLLSDTSPTIESIENFERKHLPSLPFVVSVKLNEGDFYQFQNAQKLDLLSKEIEHNSTIQILANIPRLYSHLTGQPFEAASHNSYAQFLLFAEMDSSGIPILSSELTQSYLTLLIPIQSSSTDIKNMMDSIKALESSYPNFEITVLGKLADMSHFSKLFFDELFTSLLYALGFLFLFFFIYCKSLKALVIPVSALFSILLLLSTHALFNLNLNLITLIAIILFTGLIADNLIHIFICYKEKHNQCFSTVTKPILLSNISMIIGLYGMLFSGALMREFGLELSILLVANLIFILYLLPSYLESLNTKKRT